MNNYRLLIAAGLVLTLVVSANAQRFGEAVQVTVIEVPVTVVDRSGQPVRNLTKEDFELYDDGKRVPIDYFDVVDMTTVTAEERPDAPLPPAATRHFLLLFDLANSSPGTIGRATEAAKDFVNTQMGERDLAAVATFTYEGGAKMLTSFTRNRTLLANAIETLGLPKYFKITDPLMISAAISTPGLDSGGAGGGTKEGREGAIREMLEDVNRAAANLNDSEAKNRLKIQMTNFANMARILDRLPGQKQVILLSEGFDARIVQGRENRNRTFEERQQQAAEADSIFSGEGYRTNSEDRFGSATATNDVRAMADIFRRSDVVLHAIDIRGLRGAGSEAGSMSSSRGKSNEALFLLTNPTGGTVFQNENDLSTNMTRMLKQQEVIYLLGFTAKSSGKPGKFRELKVKVKNGRVSHRPGYYESSGQVSDIERTLSLAEIMMTDTPVSDVEVTVAATPLPGPGGKARVPVLVEMTGAKFLEGISGNTATANLYLYAFDAENQVVDFLQQRISLDLAKAGDAVRGSGVRYLGTLRLPKGDYAVKALVRVEETGRAGFVRSPLTVPAFDTATILPPVGFVEPGNWAMLVGPNRGDEYAYPFSAGDATYVPQRPATVVNDSDYKLALFLYRVPLENLQVEPALVTNGGAEVKPDLKLLGRTAADERGGVKLLFNFKPAGLAKGEHELRLKVKQKDGSESVVTLPIRVL